MSKMRCIIVDDELIARKGLAAMLANYQVIEMVGEAKDRESLQKLLDQERPDLVFLDVMLRDENILDSLQQLHVKPMVVFTTAFAEHALRSYEFDALDYLLKPIEPVHLDRAVWRAYRNFSKNYAENEDMYLRINGKFHRVFLKDIVFLEGMENYVVIQTTGKKLICKATMQWFEKQLPPDQFLRVHRSYIVNKSRVDMIDKLSIVLGEFMVPISRENRGKVYSALIPGLG